MSQYAVMFNEKKGEITLENEDPKAPNEKAFTHIYLDKLGEMNDGTARANPESHIRDQLAIRDIDYRTVSVKNNTDNERLDAMEREGEEIQNLDPKARPNDALSEKDAAAPENAGRTVLTTSEDNVRARNEDDANPAARTGIARDAGKDTDPAETAARKASPSGRGTPGDSVGKNTTGSNTPA